MMLLNDLAPRITLDGAWDFSLGDQDSWSEIHVPGAWEAQGYDRRLDGPAHYRRQVTIPKEWAGSRIVLELGAVSYACRVSANGVFVGEHQGLWTPFSCNLTTAILPGKLNLIEFEVYKPSHLRGARYPFRKSLAGFIPDLATTFGGLWQEVSLQACQAWFEDLRLIADTDTEEIICSFRTCAESNQDLEGVVIDISVSLQGHQVASCTVLRSPLGSQEVRCMVPQPRRWNPEDPTLYEVELSLRRGNKVLARFHRRIGFRRLSTHGETLLFNDHPVLLRGILHWGWMPEQIAPYFSPEFVRAQIREVKRLGFNLIKLCLFVPNSTFYEIADEEGIFLWQEWPMWLPQVDADYAAHAPVEYGEYMALVHTHPSIVIYSAGCELDETVGTDLLGRLNGVMRQGMSGALFCDNSGMGEAYGGLQVDFADFVDYHTYSDLEFFEQILDHWRRDWQRPRPLIFGEFCDSDTYRDPEEIRALSDDHSNGLPLWWLTADNPVMDWRTETRPVIHQEESIAAAELGLTHQQLREISYASSLAIRKYVLETVRRRAGIGGYVITGLRDTPISTSGIFDDFGRSKWSPDQFLPFNGECALCLDGERRRRWQHGGDRVDRFDLQNEWTGEWMHRRLIFSSPGLVYQGVAKLTWQLTDVSGRVLAEEERQVEVDLKGIRPQEISSLTFQLPLASLPQELCLKIKFSSPTIQARNSWSFWIYPKRQPQTIGQTSAPVLYDPSFLLSEFEEQFDLKRQQQKSSLSANDIVIASSMPDWAEDFLKSGGKMILLQWNDGLLPVLRRPFWREAIRIFAPHPLWDTFGAGGDLRFLGVSSDVSFDLARLEQVIPALDEVRPIFRRLDGRDFRVSEYLLEARLGRGVLLACSLRLAGGHGRQPSGLRRNVAGQALLWTMLDYLVKEPG